MKKNELETLKRHLKGGLSAVNKLLLLTNDKKSCNSSGGCTCSNADRLTGDGHPDTDSVKVTVCACKVSKK